MTLRYSIHVTLEENEDIFGVTLEEEEIYASNDKNQAVQVFDRMKEETENIDDTDGYKFTVSIYLSDETEENDIAFVTPIATSDKDNAISEYAQLCDFWKKKLLPNGS